MPKDIRVLAAPATHCLPLATPSSRETGGRGEEGGRGGGGGARADCEVQDLDAIILDLERLGLLVVILVVRLLEHIDDAAVRAAHETLRVGHDGVDRIAIGRGGRKYGLELAGVEQQQLAGVRGDHHALLRHPRMA